MEIKKDVLVRRQGFTLIELLVAVAILSIVSVLIVQTFFLSIKTSTKAEALRNAKQNGEYAMEVMTRLVRNARTIDMDCTEAGVATSSVALLNRDGGKTILTCAGQEDGTSIASVSAQAETTDYLTGTNVTLGTATCGEDTPLTFTCTGFSGSPESIKISFTLYQKTASIDIPERGSAEFSSTISLRN